VDGGEAADPRRNAAPEINDPIIVVYGAETPLRSRDITRLFFCLEEPSVGQSRCDLTPKSLRQHATRRYAVIWLPRHLRKEELR
jgi:hypothetical protein